MPFVWFGELLLRHVPLLVPASTKSVRLRSRGHRFVSSSCLKLGSVNAMMIGDWVYLDCEIFELLRSPALLQYHQRLQSHERMSRPVAAGEATSNSQRPQCRLRRHGSQYVSQAYACQW
jgi:hypothetical protein